MPVSNQQSLLVATNLSRSRLALQPESRSFLPLVVCGLFVWAIAAPSACLAERPVIPRGDGAPGENVEATPQARAGLDQRPPDDAEFAQAPAQLPIPPGAIVVGQADGDDDINADVGLPELDDVDSRLPVERTAQLAWTRAHAAERESNWTRLIQQAQRLTGAPGQDRVHDTFVWEQGPAPVAAWLDVARVLGRMPADVLESRSRSTDAQARVLINDALAANDLRRLSRLAVQFAGTQAGFEAADAVAVRLADRGDFGPAAHWLQVLRDINPPFARDPAWQQRADLVLQLTGLEKPRRNNKGLEPIASDVAAHTPSAGSDWPLLNGNAARSAQPSGDRPLPIVRWQHRTTSSGLLRRDVSRLLERVTNAETAPIPAAVPVCVGNSILCSTFRGLEAIDATTGRSLWTAARDTGLEQLMQQGSDAESQRYFVRGGMDTYMFNHQGLAQFIYHNGSQGLISADHERVYYVQDDPVFATGQSELTLSGGNDASPRIGSATANRLTAFNLRTGRPEWQIGGPTHGTAFATPLAGWFILGSPLPVDDDLFVVARQDDLVAAFCLDPATGAERWQQPLAEADHKVNRNLVARLWSVQPAVANGVLVCPTTAGWAVGLDRNTGMLLWASRLPVRGEGQNEMIMNRLFGWESSDLIESASTQPGGAWLPSSPIIVGDRVLFTQNDSAIHPEDNLIVCVNLYTGKRLWQLPRGDMACVAGIESDRVLIIGSNGYRALGLTGVRKWEETWAETDGRPCGRGFVQATSMWVPMTSQRLLRIDTETGKVQERLTLPDDESLPGTLLLHGDTLLSVGPLVITAYEQQGPLTARLDAIRREQRSTPESDLLEARVAVSRNDLPRASSILQSRLSMNLAPDMRERYLGALLDAVKGRLADEPRQCADILTGVSFSGFELLQQQLLYEVYRRLNQPADSFQALLAIERAFEDGFRTHPLNARMAVSLRCWLAARLADTWQQLDGAQQTQLSESISQRAAALTAAVRDLPNDVVAQREVETFAELFSFHPAGIALQEQFYARARSANDSVAANHWLDRLANSSNRKTAHGALFRRLQTMTRDTHSPGLAADILRRLRTQGADVVLPDGKMVSTIIPQAAAQAQQIVQDPAVSWGKFALKLDRMPVSQTNSRVPLREMPWVTRPFADHLKMEWQNENPSRLMFSERQTGQVVWAVTLRGESSYGEQPEMRGRDGVLFVQRGNVVNTLSIADRRLLWSRAVDPPAGSSDVDENDWRSNVVGVAGAFQTEVSSDATQYPPGRMIPGGDWSPAMYQSPRQPLPAFHADYLCCRGERSLTVLDAFTGDVRWKLKPVASSCVVFGSRHAVYVMNGPDEIRAYHPMDGSPVEKNAVEALLPHAVRVEADRLVTIRKAGESDAWQVAGHSADTGAELWSHDLSSRTIFGVVGWNELPVAQRSGQIDLINLITGEMTSLERIPSRQRIGRDPWYVLQDQARYYVVFNGNGTENTWKEGEAVQLPATGQIVAYDRQTGAIVWNYSSGGQLMFADAFRDSPAIVLTRTTNEGLFDEFSTTTRLTILNRETGDVLLERDLPVAAEFSEIEILADGRTIELSSSNERLRLTAVAAGDGS